MCAPHNTTLQETGHTETEPMESQHTIPEQPNLTSEAISHQSPNKNNDLGDIKDLMVEIRDTLKNVKSVLIGTQNSLARGFNSSSLHSDYRGHPVGYDIGAHSLINDQGEVPEMYNLPTFKYENYNVLFAINDLAESVLARYLRFYSIGEEMIEEEEELKIKSGMIDDARKCLSARLFLNR
ncbi:hypothetical protein OPQ81_005296 [Rhizoctonia solani]|nr:hypothetical protein OPQ81_005296 [Rhizoctonia solani]